MMDLLNFFFGQITRVAVFMFKVFFAFLLVGIPVASSALPGWWLGAFLYRSWEKGKLEWKKYLRAEVFLFPLWLVLWLGVFLWNSLILVSAISGHVVEAYTVSARYCFWAFPVIYGIALVFAFFTTELVSSSVAG